jgi:hypothetical protein
MKMRQRKWVGCDPVHKKSGRPVLNFRNGRKNPPNTVRSEGRHRHRLRLDRRRRCCCLDRADLSHPDLIQRQDGRLDARHVWVSASARRKVQPASTFPGILEWGARGFRQNPSSTNARLGRDSHVALCESGIRHVPASVPHGSGALSRPASDKIRRTNPDHGHP